jgi:hypothetical protein
LGQVAGAIPKNPLRVSFKVVKRAAWFFQSLFRPHREARADR